ncbi:MAG TPA: VOC family protein [Methanothrix sp.]|nr:VOC family protein [Methanothrix sp.]
MYLKHNIVGWFEIPVLDMDRAVRFYETVFEIKLDRRQLGPLEMAWFPWVEGGMGSSGSLVRSEFHKPSDEGVRIYFTAFSGDVAVEAGRVAAAGGEVLMPRTQISEDIGYMAVVRDTEGNRICLHSRT